MGIIELFLIGVGLSMDALAVSVCKGLSMRTINYRHAFVIALFFGGFQGIMPTIGWLLGASLESYITNVDHWIAFVLLAFIGGKMLRDALHGEDENEPSEADDDQSTLDLRELAMLAVATSIDALAVGITLAFLGVDIVSSALLIACTTFVISFVGVVFGNRLGTRFQKRAQVVGGAVLVLIGTKILLEHLGILL